MLFDLVSDPNELNDLGTDSASRANDKARRRTGAMGPAAFATADPVGTADPRHAWQGGTARILIGVWDETDIAPELWSGYQGG